MQSALKISVIAAAILSASASSLRSATGGAHDELCYNCVEAFDEAGGCEAIHNGDEVLIHEIIGGLPAECEEAKELCGEEMAMSYCGFDPSAMYDMYDMNDGPSEFCQGCITDFDENGGCAALHNFDEAGVDAAVPNPTCKDECDFEHVLSYCGIDAASMMGDYDMSGMTGSDGDMSGMTGSDGDMSGMTGSDGDMSGMTGSDGDMSGMTGSDYDMSGMTGSDGDGPPAGCTATEPASWHGDNHCDPAFNNYECGYDGGDCCGPDVSTTFCGDDCKCEDPNDPHFGSNYSPVGPSDGPSGTMGGASGPSGGPSDSPDGPPAGCNSSAPAEWHGDDYCDPAFNNYECGFDGGDCCGPDVNTAFCGDECKCEDPNHSDAGMVY